MHVFRFAAMAVFLAAANCRTIAQHGAVATVHPLATRAAVDVIRSGGNAVDAIVAAGLVLGVVDGFNSGIGGGCFILLRLPDGAVAAIDGRETAPGRATRDMFLRDDEFDADLSLHGALAVAVPGALAAYEHASRHFGTIPFERLLLRAGQLAEDGFEIGTDYVDRVAEAIDELRPSQELKDIFLTANGAAPPLGWRLRQPELAHTYRTIAAEGTDWFYRGPFAQTTGAWMANHEGRLRAEDFEIYSVRTREPVRSTYRGVEVIGFPPPSSGGVHVAEILNILEAFDLRQYGPRSTMTCHLIAEAMKLAFADRAHWLGDPDFARVPMGLVSADYARRLARRIRLDRTLNVDAHSSPSDVPERRFGGHTTHFSAADAAGNWVACTATINTTFGSKVVAPGTGVVLNNEMDDFAAQPGVPNVFGLIGAEANAIAPGKRPLSSMSPTILLKDGAPILSVGAAGGPTIISQTVCAIVNMVDFGMTASEALAEPRLHHQWRPDELRVERGMGTSAIAGLTALGHKVTPVDSLGVAQAVAWEGNRFSAVHDPRVHGGAESW